MNNHITQIDGWYVAWDETGSEEIGRYSTYERAEKAIKEYCIQLDGMYGENYDG